MDTFLRSARAFAEPVDLLGADAPERHAAVQVSGKNVDMNIIAGTYIAGVVTTRRALAVERAVALTVLRRAL